MNGENDRNLNLFSTRDRAAEPDSQDSQASQPEEAAVARESGREGIVRREEADIGQTVTEKGFENMVKIAEGVYYKEIPGGYLVKLDDESTYVSKKGKLTWSSLPMGNPGKKRLDAIIGDLAAAVESWRAREIAPVPAVDQAKTADDITSDPGWPEEATVTDTDEGRAIDIRLSPEIIVRYFYDKKRDQFIGDKANFDIPAFRGNNAEALEEKAAEIRLRIKDLIKKNTGVFDRW